MTEPMDAVVTDAPLSELRPEEERLESGSKNNLNTTAYRIFKILQWLNEEPLSVEALNDKFYNEPLIQKRLSNDSIWLYINTLKALGCEIRRPGRSNQFRYVLERHPFGILLTPEDRQALAHVKMLAEQEFNHQELLSLDALMKKLLTRSAFSSTSEEVEQYIREHFKKSRSVDYEGKQALILALQEAAQTGQLLHITYESSVRGKSRFGFLPQTLAYEKGVLYLRGYRQDSDELSSLRAERIIQAEPLDNPELRRQLASMEERQFGVALRLYVPSEEDYEPLEMGERSLFFEDETGSYMKIKVFTRDFFLLKQKLLASGYPVYIESPVAFREEFIGSLSQMLRFYEENSDEE